MKQQNLERAKTLCADIANFEHVIEITVSKSCKVQISIGDNKYGDRTITIPADHNNFLKRVIRDRYQGLINKMQAELETL